MPGALTASADAQKNRPGEAGTISDRKTRRSLLAGRDFVARGGWSCLALGARTMRPAPPARIAFATAGTALETGLAAIRAGIHLRLRAGDEGRQAIDAAGIGDDGLRLVRG